MAAPALAVIVTHMPPSHCTGDHRVFVGDLGNEVTDDLLAHTFNKYVREDMPMNQADRLTQNYRIDLVFWRLRSEHSYALHAWMHVLMPKTPIQVLIVRQSPCHPGQV